MLCTIGAMADLDEGYSVNTALVLENSFSLNGVKEEECQDDNDKVDISETAIIKDNVELLPKKMKQHDICTTWDNIKTELSFSEAQHDVIHGLKIEEGIDAHMKCEFNSGFLYCEDCHESCEEYCTQCGMLVHILNRTAMINDNNRSQAELPRDDMLEIQDYFGGFHIFALKVIPAGVKFGPFVGLNRTEHPWRIKGGKLVVNTEKSKYLNWMQYINPARNISEQNLLVFQYEHNLYYQSTCQIQQGDELLVYFGEEYEDSLNKNVEMDFTPVTKHILKDVFACISCCLGFSSKLYLAKHKTICLRSLAGTFSVEELIQCPYCNIHLDRKEYITYHMAYCSEINCRKYILPTQGNRVAKVSGRKLRPWQIYKCPQCQYRTKYKGDLEKHTNQHYKVKMCKCGICSKRFKTKEILRLHVETAHIGAAGKEDSEHSTGVYTNGHFRVEHSRSIDKMKQFKCLICEFRTKYKTYLKTHFKSKHLNEFKYKCERCDYITNVKGSLKTHMDTRHMKEFKFKCEPCNYKTNVKGNLKKHIETRHLKKFKYQCDSCDYKANLKQHLKIHVEGKHLKEFKYQCDMCDYKANLKFQLKKHVDTKHLKEFKYKCDICDYKANLKQHLKRHIEGKHLKEFKYQCDICDYKANERSQLKAHIDTRHLQEFEYKCDTCDYKTNLKSHLNRHIEGKHLQEFKYQCDICDYKANQKGHLKAHIEGKHLKEFKHKCDRCDYKSNFKFALKKHIQGKHLKVKHKCDSCDYETNLMSCLKRHIEGKHLNEFKYKCERCEYKTNWKSHLDTHVKARHLKEFKYKCETCDYQTYANSNLKRHIEGKHLKGFKYQCDMCDYKASQKGNLKTHIKAMHLKEFEHKCDSCNYKTNVMSYLQRHIEGKHLKEFKYQCDICDYKTNRKVYLKAHIETKHLKEFKHKCDLCEYKSNFKSALKKHIEGKHLK